MPLSDQVETRVRRLALENAVAHGGEARTGPIVARLLATEPELRPRAEELRDLVASVVADIRSLPEAEIADRLTALGGPEPERARAEKSDTGDFPDLPGAVPGRVVVRLAPFPSGVLHIGHGRMLFINQHYREKYQGKLLLVFDDTPGSEEKRVEVEFFDLIREDCERAGVRPDATYYKSDRVPTFYPWARRVIERRGAYVCHCSAEVLRANRAAGIACPERAQSLETTLDEWEKMLGNAYGPGEAVLRLRTSLEDPDPAFRDRVLFRISDLDHPRVGRKYSVWPMLEFSWAVDDIELGVTHVLRGKDLVIEDRVQRFIWDLLGEKGVPFLHWGILRVREAKVAKSKAYREVKSGLYDGWADPRTWSFRSLERRGIATAAVKQFILSFGLSLADIEVPAETLYAENRKRIDATTARRSFVPEPVRLAVAGYPDTLRAVTLPNHPEFPALGTREVPAGPEFFLPRRDLERSAGGEIRLKDLLNVRLPPTIAAGDGLVRAEFTGRENRRLPRIQWVAAGGAVPVDVLTVDGTHTPGVGEATLLAARPGDIFQFERFGFVRVDTEGASGGPALRVVYGHP